MSPRWPKIGCVNTNSVYLFFESVLRIAEEGLLRTDQDIQRSSSTTNYTTGTEYLLNNTVYKICDVSGANKQRKWEFCLRDVNPMVL